MYIPTNEIMYICGYAYTPNEIMYICACLEKRYMYGYVYVYAQLDGGYVYTYC